MKRKIMTLLLCGVLSATALQGAVPAGGVACVTREKKLADGRLRVAMAFCLDSLRLGTDRQIYLTPVLEGADGEQKVLPSVLVNGRNMHFAYLRGSLPSRELRRHQVEREVRRLNGRPQTVDYEVEVPCETWMLRPGAVMKVVADTCGCGNPLGSGIGSPEPLDLNPANKMRSVYITPRVTELPVAIHEGRARVQFEVDRTELHAEPYRCRNGQRIDNRAQLQVIDDSVRYALADPNVEIASISVCGYASPESPYLHNEFLSTGRSRALAEYLGRKYNLPEGKSTYSSVAENWGEFREMADTSSMINEKERADLLALIDRPVYGAADYDAKERELKTDPRFARLYRTLILPEWFPRLRATTFAITTRLRPLDDERLAEVMKKTPGLMSLNQMMRVARLYPEGSERFNEAIATALEFYPDDETANLNAATAAIMAGDFGKAGGYLEKAGNSPEAENARGILATARGEFETAKAFFDKAGDLPDARANRDLLP